MYSCKQCDYTTDIRCNLARHQQRKTLCGQNINIPGHDHKSFKRIDDKYFECLFCHKRLCIKLNRHLTVCKRVPVNTCIFCKKQFNHQSTHSRHKKTCKARPMPAASDTTINNGTTIVINNYNDNRTYIQHNTFGHEDLSILLNKMEQDPRLQEAVSNFKTALSLVHFNKDFPENQTIRKMNKRSNTIELRQSVDPERWALEPFETGFERVMDNLQRQLKLDLNHTYPINYVRDHVYNLSKMQPTVSTSELVPVPMCRIESDGEPVDRERLRQIALEARNRFLKECQCETNWELDRSNVERCRAFKDRLHDMFRQKGLLYKVVNTYEPSQLWHIFEFLTKRQDDLKYANTRL